MGNEYGSETLEPCYFAEFIFSDSAILNINCCSSSLVPSFFSCHSFMVPSFLRVIATFFFSFHCFYKGSPPLLILLSSSSFFDFSHSILHFFTISAPFTLSLFYLERPFSRCVPTDPTVISRQTCKKDFDEWTNFCIK